MFLLFAQALNPTVRSTQPTQNEAAAVLSDIQSEFWVWEFLLLGGMCFLAIILMTAAAGALVWSYRQGKKRAGK